MRLPFSCCFGDLQNQLLFVDAYKAIMISKDLLSGCLVSLLRRERELYLAV